MIFLNCFGFCRRLLLEVGGGGRGGLREPAGKAYGGRATLTVTCRFFFARKKLIDQKKLPFFIYFIYVNKRF